MDVNNIVLIIIGLSIISSALTIFKKALGDLAPFIVIIGLYLLSKGIITTDMIQPYFDKLVLLLKNVVEALLGLLP